MSPPLSLPQIRHKCPSLFPPSLPLSEKHSYFTNCETHRQFMRVETSTPIGKSPVQLLQERCIRVLCSGVSVKIDIVCISEVYLTLCCTLIASAVGAYFHIFWDIGGFITAFGSAGSIIWITSILKNPHEEQKGVAALMASGFCYGATFGLGIDLAVPIHPSILVSAFVGCAVAFGCFSAAAMLTRRREYLYLGGLLSSSLFLLFWLHFASSVIGGSYALFTFDLYFGLMVFMGYNVIHTQGMIGRAHSGDLNYINDALGLFTGILTFTIGLFIITLKNVQNAW